MSYWLAGAMFGTQLLGGWTKHQAATTSWKTQEKVRKLNNRLTALSGAREKNTVNRNAARDRETAAEIRLANARDQIVAEGAAIVEGGATNTGGASVTRVLFDTRRAAAEGEERITREMADKAIRDRESIIDIDLGVLQRKVNPEAKPSLSSSLAAGFTGGAADASDFLYRRNL